MKRGRILLSAPVTCPHCGYEFRGRWTEGEERGAVQTCPCCLRDHEAAWPQFTFEPERVVLPADGE